MSDGLSLRRWDTAICLSSSGTKRTKQKRLKKSSRLRETRLEGGISSCGRALSFLKGQLRRGRFVRGLKASLLTQAWPEKRKGYVEERWQMLELKKYAGFQAPSKVIFFPVPRA